MTIMNKYGVVASALFPRGIKSIRAPARNGPSMPAAIMLIPSRALA